MDGRQRGLREKRDDSKMKTNGRKYKARKFSND
jgi:hypothetical protein